MESKGMESNGLIFALEVQPSRIDSWKPYTLDQKPKTIARVQVEQ